MADELIYMTNTNTGEGMDVHPTAVKDHEAVGWKVTPRPVEDKAEKTEKAKK